MTGTLSPVEMLAEFHVAQGQPFGHGAIGKSSLRIKLHREETKELVAALAASERVAIAQELADVVYVAYGTAHSLGITLVVPERSGYSGTQAARFSSETFALVLAFLVQDLDDVATALAALVSEAYWTARLMDIPLDAVFAEVHAANMRKIGPDGPILRFDGKLLKPDGWTPPDVAGVLAEATRGKR